METRLTFLGTGTSQGVPMIGCECDVCTSPDPRDKRLRASVFVEYGGWQRVQARLTFCHRLVPSVKTIGDDDMFLFEFFGYMVMFAVVLAIAGCSIVAFVVFGLSFAALLGSVIGALGYWIGRFFKRVTR